MTPPPLPPGSILVEMYLNERLRLRKPGRFIEIGTGRGLLSRQLLALGWTGIGFDLNPDGVAVATALNANAVREGRMQFICGDWLSTEPMAQVDLVISCMVLEHLDEAAQQAYLTRCAAALRPGGIGMLVVPASPAAWGVEDDLAGHYRRYTAASLRHVLKGAGFDVGHMAGLAFPISNMLLPLSNFLIARQLRRQAYPASKAARTVNSGMLKIAGKTSFPILVKLLVNKVTLYPLHLVQKLCRSSPRAIVLLAEFSPAGPAA